MVPMMAGSKAPGLSDALARVYEVGPIIWIKRAAGACVPWKEGTAGSWSQVQLLLPRANDGNVVFSLSEAVRQRRQPVYGFEQHPPWYLWRMEIPSATTALQNSADVKTVSSMLGHHDIAQALPSAPTPTLRGRSRTRQPKLWRPP